MAKISVFLKGTKLAEHFLEPGKAYVLGRSAQCDIVIDDQELSRRHLDFKYDGENWQCHVLSKYGRLSVNGNSVDHITLASGRTFTVASYEVRFENEKIEVTSEIQVKEEESESEVERALNDDKTRITEIELTPVLFRLAASGEPVEEIILGSNLIEAGRSRTSQITLEEPQAARKQFSIKFDGQVFIIANLNNSYPTLVNGRPIASQPLETGDEISVGSDNFRYELHSPIFENLPVIAEDAQPAVIRINPENSILNWLERQSISHFPQYVKRYKRLSKEKKRVYRLVPLIVVILAIAGVLASRKTGHEGTKVSSSLGKNAETLQFEKLPPEQRKFIEETYYLSLNLYTSGKYELAAIEIAKIFQLVPNYKDARNIEARCQEALEIKKEKDENERVQREQGDLHMEVTSILNNCEGLLISKKFGQVEDCVQKVAEMDPENERARYLMETAKLKLGEISNAREAQEAIARRGVLAHKTFEKGMKLYKEKRYPAAVTEFNTVTMLAFTDSDGLKLRAKQGIQAAKEKMLADSASFVKEGKSALDNRDFKTAVTKLSRAVELAPENEEAQKYKQKAVTELHLEIKNLYAESVIEENLGNIESAKKKWHTIIDQAGKNDGYYEKAKIKLGKYEK